ncbi:MAG: hypothetical protein M1401_00525 [Chloroflexi bacterium]|nr:hypothetical protein [Chloroflexota bacterium]
MANTTNPAPATRDERLRLREGVLRLGGMLGWQPAEIIAFTEALTNRPWRRCSGSDFRLVLEEYAIIAQLLAGKANKAPSGGHEGGCAEVEADRNAD